MKFPILAGCVLVLIASCGNTEPIHSAANTQALEGQYTDAQLEEIAIAYLDYHKNKYQILSPAESISIVTINRDQLNTQHLKFVQRINGVPIWSSEFIVHIKQGEVYLLSGNPYPDQAKFPTAPEIGIAEAEAIASKNVSKNDSTLTANSKLVILPVNGRAMTLCYLVEINAGLKRYIIFVDSKGGEIIKKLEGMPSQFEHQGQQLTN